MAYEPKTWSCGETITADALNHIEDGIANADKGYECTYTRGASVFEGGLTTNSMGETNFRPSQSINSDTIIVAIDGNEYQLPKVAISYGDGYGEFLNGNPVFENYQCAVIIDGRNHYLLTPSEGTYQVKIEELNIAAETTLCFKKAVKSVGCLEYVKDGENKSVKEGYLGNIASGEYSHAEGYNTTASGSKSHAEGYYTTASGENSHAEGQNTTASGSGSHAEGYNTTASEIYSHAEGDSTTASVSGSHAEGGYTKATGYGSHAEGQNTTASGRNSHAEGSNTTASENYSHAEGYYTTASGENSHAEGSYTIANHKSNHVFGEYNVADPSTAPSYYKGNYIEIVGNGSNSNSRSNARTLDWSGNETLQGSITLGKGTADETTITATQLKALLALLNA